MSTDFSLITFTLYLVVFAALHSVPSTAPIAAELPPALESFIAPLRVLSARLRTWIDARIEAKPVGGRRPVGGPDLIAFLFGGLAAFIGTLAFSAGGFRAMRGERGYQATLQFPNACGLVPGSAVRIRGVPVGRAIAVTPATDRVNVTVEIEEETTAIPRNSIVHANQTGLITETIIDITPQLPVQAFKALPTDPDCEKEGVLVCHGGTLSGEGGVSLDEIVHIMTKMASKMDLDGYSRAMATAEATQLSLKESRPLIQHAARLVKEIIPIVRELRDGKLVRNIESLSATSALAANEIHKLSQDVFSDENVVYLRDSILTLSETLKNVESISGDIARSASDKQVQANMRQLIEALNRLFQE